MKKILASLLLLVSLASPAAAQDYVKLWPNGTSGSITANAGAVTIANAREMATFGIDIRGTFVGTIAPQCSIDGTNWQATFVTPTNGTTAVTSMTTTGIWIGAINGCKQVRVVATAWTSGTATITLNTTQSSGGGNASVDLSGASFTGNAAAGATGSAVPASADYTGINIGGTLTGQTGVSVGTARAGAVAIVDGSGNQITSFGGGTQYAEAATAATITGTAVMFESNTGTNTLSVVNATTPLPTTTVVTSAPTTTVTATNLDVQIGGSDILQVQSNSANLATQTTAAAILAKQPALGTAGSSSTDVISVQGIASGTALPVSVASIPSHAVTNAGTFVVQENGTALTALQLIDNIPNTIGSTTSGQSGVLGLCATTTAAPTTTTAQSSALSCDTSGALRVVGSAGTTQYVEDAVATDGASLVAVGAIRRDTTPSSSAGTAGDNAQLTTDANGRLYTNSSIYTTTGTSAVDSTAAAVKVLNVDSAGTAIVSDTQGTHATTLGTITSVTGSLLMGNASTATPTDVGADGDASLFWLTRNGALNIADAGGSITVDGTVTITDGAGAVNVICDSGCSGGTQYTQDAALTVGTTIGTMAMGRASAAVPTDVSADNDAVLPWYLRSGAIAVQPTYAGVLSVAGSGTISTGTQRITIATDDPVNDSLVKLDAAIVIEDAGETAAANLVGIGTVRRDSAASSAGTTGDNATLNTDANGKLWVNAEITTIPTVTVTDGAGAMNVICDSGCSGGTQYTQDAALTVGTTVGTMAMGRASAAVPTDVSADGDAVIPWYLRSGALSIQPTFAGVLGVAGNGTSGTGVQRVTLANDSTGVLATVSTVTSLSQFAGNAINLGAGAVGTGTLRMVIATDDPVNDAAVKIDANMVAHDAADAGNPLKVGFKADSSLADNTLVAAADRTDAFADLDGAQITRPWAPLADLAQDRATNTDGTSTAFAGGLAAPGASIRLYITKCTVTNTSATGGTLDLRDGAAGSVLWTIPVPAAAASSVSGAVEVFETPLKFTANTAVAYDVSAALTTVTISCAGFKSKAG